MANEMDEDPKADKPRPSREQSAEDRRKQDQRMLQCAYAADVKGVIAELNAGADVNAADPTTGLTALHIAVGTNNLTLARVLVYQFRAAFKPDGAGRWPTLIAAQAQVDDALSDYIVEAEAKAVYSA